MSHWFFLSYARNDHDDYLRRFYRDLNNTIRDWTNHGEGGDGFFDEKNIELGERWSPTLTEALQDCRTFIALYSPAYFASEMCGREWQFFSERQTAYSAGIALHACPASLIMPVLWEPEDKLPKPLPDAVAALQYKHSDFGDEYPRVGLKQLIKVKKYKIDYHNFLTKFASKLCRAARDHTLPPHPHCPPIHKVESAFHRGGTRTSDNGGPRSAQFVFVAGRRDELRAVREKLDAYGDEGGRDWHPYLPDVPEEAGIIAQRIAAEENFHYELVQLDDSIIERIEKAEERNRIVAILVDTWTLEIPRYENLLRKYNHCNYVNCAVLAPLNNKDDETKNKWADRYWKVHHTLADHLVNRHPGCFLIVNSYDELKDGLRAALHKARTRLIERAEVMRKAEGARFISKPHI